MIINEISLPFPGIKRPPLSGVIKAGIKPLTLEPFALSRGLFFKKKKKKKKKKNHPVNHFAVGQVTVAGMNLKAKGVGSAHSLSIFSVLREELGRAGPRHLGQKQKSD